MEGASALPCFPGGGGALASCVGSALVYEARARSCLPCIARSVLWPTRGRCPAVSEPAATASRSSRFSSTPGPIRTGDRRLRRPLLYPAELRAQVLRCKERG